MATRNAWERNLGCWALLDSASDLQHSHLALRLHGWSDKPDQINQIVMSRISTYRIVPTIFFKLVFRKTNTQLYFILTMLVSSGWGSTALRLQYLKLSKQCASKWLILNRINSVCNSLKSFVCKQMSSNSFRIKVSYKLFTFKNCICVCVCVCVCVWTGFSIK